MYYYLFFVHFLGAYGLITSVVYSPRMWLLWVDHIGGVLTSSVALVG